MKEGLQPAVLVTEDELSEMRDVLPTRVGLLFTMALGKAAARDRRSVQAFTAGYVCAVNDLMNYGTRCTIEAQKREAAS